MTNNKIPIVLITDSNYAMQVSVVISSIIANKNDSTIYDIFILANNLIREDKEKLSTLSTQSVSVKIIDMNGKYTDLPNKAHWSNAVFLKFDIPNIVEEYDKIIYLDADIIVQKDLTDLYRVNLKDNYAAVVPDIAQVLKKESLLQDYFNYFCAGMILFNAKKIREENLVEKMLQCYMDNNEKFLSLEQDIFNYIFGKKIVHIHPKFQYITLYDNFLKKNLLKFYKLENKDELKKENLDILHYATMTPWKFSNIAYGEIWDKYYKLSPYYNPNLKRKKYNNLLNLYRLIRYNFRFCLFKKKLFFNYE